MHDIKEKISDFIIPSLPGYLQTKWIGENIKPYHNEVLICEGEVYTERDPPELARTLFKKVAGIWVRKCNWLQIGNDVYNFTIPEAYEEYGKCYIASRADGVFRHIPLARGPVKRDEDFITMIKSFYGV